jgi:PleD family two-component response regulator
LLHSNPETMQTRIETMRALGEEVGISPDQQEINSDLTFMSFIFMNLYVLRHTNKNGLIITKFNQRSLAFKIAVDYADRLTTLENNEHTDPLIGVANRGGLDVYMESLIFNERVGIILKDFFFFLDIDNLREFNDRHYHVTGDMVLKRLVAV